MDGKFTPVFVIRIVTSSAKRAYMTKSVKTPVYVIIWRDYIEKNVVLFQARGYAGIQFDYYFIT